MSELLCGSLFSGVGGMDLGFTWAGFRHAFFAEIDSFGRAVLAARFPGVPIYEDVCDVPECGSGTRWEVTVGGSRVHALRRASLSRERDRGDADAADRQRDERHAPPRRLDVLTFGSPCQDLSVAGKRRGLDGDRSGLFWEAMRIAGDGPLRPRALLMENVEGLLSSNGGRDFALVLDAMAERGYRWSYRVLDSQHFAVPQRRRRVFVCAVADDDPRAERIAEVFALAESSGGDSPTSDSSWPSASSRARAGAPSGCVIGALTESGGAMTMDHQSIVGGGQYVTPADHKGIVNTLTASYAGVGNTQDEITLAGIEALLAKGEPHIAPTVEENRANKILRPEQGDVRKTDGDVTYYIEDCERGPVRPGLPLLSVQAFRKSARVSGPDTPETWVDDGLANTLNRFDTGDTRTTHVVTATAYNVRPEYGNGADLRVDEADVHPTLAQQNHLPEYDRGIRVHEQATVRRLTPLECERLQGWPEVDGRGWTDIPWNGKDHAPDSRRYAACGNGVTATVAYWIAARLAEVLK